MFQQACDCSDESSLFLAQRWEERQTLVGISTAEQSSCNTVDPVANLTSDPFSCHEVYRTLMNGLSSKMVKVDIPS